MIENLIAYLPIALRFIILTCIVELTVALIFKIFNYKVILVANITSQIFLHIVVLFTFYTFLRSYTLIIYICLELLVLVFEYTVYSNFIKDKKKILLAVYVFSANLASFLAGLLLNKINI
ncbi:UNVERIFIED_CONTAM: hypothetical protein Cloal_0890 [Acetivibrio alkalicellulosi]